MLRRQGVNPMKLHNDGFDGNAEDKSYEAKKEY